MTTSVKCQISRSGHKRGNSLETLSEDRQWRYRADISWYFIPPDTTNDKHRISSAQLEN